MSKQPLRPVPYPDDESGPFWEACGRHELVLQTCASCEHVRFPPRAMCPRCQSFESRWEPASGRGRVWSWVVAHPPVLPSFADRVPFNVAVIELEPAHKGADPANKVRAENLLYYCNDDEDIVELCTNAIESMFIFGAGMTTFYFLA